MALSFFEQEESSSSGDLPFCEEYLKENPKNNGKVLQVREVFAVKSGKGYLIKTDECIGWLWRKEKTTSQLLEALQYYVEIQHGFGLFLVLDKNAKAKFKLAVDSEVECSWFGDEKKYTVVEDGHGSREAIQSNPFLIPHPLSTPTMQPATNLSMQTTLASTNGKTLREPRRQQGS
jgi:hypothetical protein